MPLPAFFRLALPMTIPAIAALAIFQFLFVWNDLLVSLIYIGPTNPDNLPMTVRVGGALEARGNVLEIEVTNLPANRIRDLDMRKVPWKIMDEINLVDIRYRPFDAATWQPQPSGLLGPVRLVPLQRLKPLPSVP